MVNCMGEQIIICFMINHRLSSIGYDNILVNISNIIEKRILCWRLATFWNCNKDDI